MNFKLKSLVAAAVLVAAIPAHAGINTGPEAAGSSLVLTLLNTTANISAAFDLGKTYQDFNIASNTGYANSGVTNSGTAFNWDFASNADYSAAWSAFVTAAGSNFGSTQWTVAAVDTSGAGTGQLGVIQTYAGSIGSYTSPQMITTVGNYAAYLANNDVLGTNATVANGADFVLSTDPAFATIYTVGGTGQMNGTGPVTLGSLGSALNLVQFTSVAATRNVPAPQSGVNLFGNGANFVLSSTGALAYSTTPVASVPEADTSAMMLAGLGLMGFIARRRTQA